MLWIAAILGTVLGLGVGVGGTSLVDKFYPDKLPQLPVVDPVTKAIDWKKVIFLGVIGGIGFLIVKWVGRKLHVKFLK